jgi:hypothetical protein
MRHALRFGGVALAIAVGWMLFGPPPSVSQPIAFSHARHAQLACVACHRGVETATRAGLPGAADCLKCHAAVPGLAAGPPPRRERSGEAGAAPRLAWVQVTKLPDHALFSHRRHVSIARLDCASCHGDVRARTAAFDRAPMRLDMDACVSCHRREGFSDDCAWCHR